MKSDDDGIPPGGCREGRGANRRLLGQSGGILLGREWVVGRCREQQPEAALDRGGRIGIQRAKTPGSMNEEAQWRATKDLYKTPVHSR
jgi:hypothetical protein